MLDEVQRWIHQVRPMPQMDADWCEGTPVDRNGDARADEPERLCCLERTHVARSKRRPPAGDRQQRDVDRAKREHGEEQGCIAGEVDARAALDDEAETAAGRTERHPEAGVTGR